MGRVTGLFTAEASGEPMIEHETVEVVDGGIVGDRYCSGEGTYSLETGCQMTLIAQSAIEVAADRHDIDISDGRHRRNVVCAGVDLQQLLDATVQLGTTMVRGTRPRPPCAYLEELTGTDGIASALTDGRGGICVDVLQPGTVAVGDPIEIRQPDPETAGRQIAARLADGDPGPPVDHDAATDSTGHDTSDSPAGHDAATGHDTSDSDPSAGHDGA